METTRRTEIVFETHRLLSIRTASTRVVPCDVCGDETGAMVRLDEAIVVTPQLAQLFTCLFEKKPLHLANGPNGILVCLRSVDAAYRELMSEADTQKGLEDPSHANTK